MPRIFVYEGREFSDPDPNLTPDQVREQMANFFPELANADTAQIKSGEDTVIEFRRKVGTKGGPANQGSFKLDVAVRCSKCGAQLYAKNFTRYQTKGGRWDIGIKIAPDDLSSHACPTDKPGESRID